MTEGVPKMPANDNRSPESSFEGAAETLARAKEKYVELKTCEGQVVDAATHRRIKILSAELHQIMMDPELTWSQLVEAGLPWDPYLEIVRQTANDNRSPVA